MAMRARFLVGLLACLALPAAAGAQNPQTAAPGEPHTQMAPPNSPSPPPEQIRPAEPGLSSQSGKTLSERLSRQQGTIQPLTVDPRIHAPLPPNAQGTMPVIPPPGTPGGNEKVVPK
jgi:hypothetical protein